MQQREGRGSDDADRQTRDVGGTIAAGGMVAHRAAQGADPYDWRALAQDVKAKHYYLLCSDTPQFDYARNYLSTEGNVLLGFRR
jgi:hypothetical protein